MQTGKKPLWLLVNLLGGLAVIGSYLAGFLLRPGAGEVLWGRVPAWLQPAYTVGMFLAAAGYLLIAFHLLRLQERGLHIWGKPAFSVFSVIYLLILVPSALWLPLTFLAVDQGSNLLAWLVRADLTLVAAGALSLLFALGKIQPARGHPWRLLLVIACLAFCFQTVLLDAIIWSSLFRV
jgi:hypothetical protein